MISAKEAKDVVMQGKYEKAVKQMELIESEIKKAIEKGSFNASFNGSICSANKEKLETLGYKVDSGSQYNESYFSVSWK
jgi:hypothetical protein